MIIAHKRKDHGVHLVCTLSNGTLHVIGLLFVDNMDLKHLNMNKVETAAEAYKELQKSISNWGKVLLATGGALKPAKCFYHLISFKWKPDGTWADKDNNLNPDSNLVVPLEDGTLAPIKHLSVTSSTKTRGSMTCPTGSNDGAILQMKGQAQGWIEKAKSSTLYKRNIWFLMDVQFWPKLSFGIGSIATPFATLED
jgi:hypothetical protein